MLSSKGQTLLELVIVMAVVVIIVAALVFATIFSIRNAQFSKNQAQATKLAQEGLERVRAGRDRNLAINSGGALGSVISWNGNNTPGSAVWDYQINGNCGDTTAVPPSYCFLNVNGQGVLDYKGPFTPGSKLVPDTSETVGIFKRAVIVSDDATFADRKTVTVIVTWSDFAGSHQSKLTTILRKI